MFGNLAGSLLSRMGGEAGQDGVPAWLRMGAQVTQVGSWSYPLSEGVTHCPIFAYTYK